MKIILIMGLPGAGKTTLANELEKPILIEGPPGVGKTELANTAALYYEKELLRLQCYEGLDETKALYEWRYGKQLLYTQILKEQMSEVLEGAKGLKESLDRLSKFEDIFFSEQFLESRPLLQSLTSSEGNVLLIDEVDKADEEFEALLLEILSEFQVSIPELGVRKAVVKPLVILTSNNSREIGDALKRRCLHLYIPFPDAKLEREIIRARVPEISKKLQVQLVDFVQGLRELDLKKLPAISETIDWARTLIILNADELNQDLARSTLNVLLKHQQDIEVVQKEVPRLVMASDG